LVGLVSAQKKKGTILKKNRDIQNYIFSWNLTFQLPAVAVHIHHAYFLRIMLIKYVFSIIYNGNLY